MYKFRLTDGTLKIDFINGALRLSNPAWWDASPAQPTIAQITMPYGTQARTLGFNSRTRTIDLTVWSSADSLRNTLGRLNVLLENAKRKHDDPTYADWVWLEEETSPLDKRRTLVCGGSWQWIGGVGSSPLLANCNAQIRLVLLLHQFYEDMTAKTDVHIVNDSATALVSVGDFAILEDDNVTGPIGEMPARISEFILRGEAANSVDMTTFWVGMRPEGECAEDFEPVWIMTDGEHFTDTADGADPDGEPVADGGGGTVMLIDMTGGGTETLVERCHIHLSDVYAANAKCAVGRYLLLGRIRATATLHCNVQMRAGWLNPFTHDGGPLPAAEKIAIDHASHYTFRELGFVQIPPPGEWDNSSLLPYTNFTVQIFAELTDGAGYCCVDCLTFIPADWALHVSRALVHDDEEATGIITMPNERIFGYNYTLLSGLINSSCVPAPRQWYIPRCGRVLMVMAGQGDDEQYPTDTIDAGITWYNRWLAYRHEECGSES